MSHYRQRLILDANPTMVYSALTTIGGLRSWWTQDCDGAIAVGGTIHIRFGRTHKAMHIEQLTPGREVRWLCTEAYIAAAQLTRKDEWEGTRLVFRTTPDRAGRTRLDFEHIGLVTTFECYGLCSSGWRHFLDSLQQWVGTGRGTPYEPATAEVA